MAVETEHFNRDDIYTLFVTTRIINFIKGFEFAESEISLADILSEARKRNSRSAVGVEVLERLFTERRLYAATPSGFKQLERFKYSIFDRVWSRLSYISTQNINRIVFI